jgi:ABC-type sugar transport system substrate-binding protein/predicted Ser/Thr protein kinase
MQSDQLIGRQINSYIIERRIGQGGMASVYQAHQSSVNRAVALKVIQLGATAAARREEFRQRFAQEARVIAALEHIHILPVYDYGIVDDDFAWIAMRLLRGGTLADRLAMGALPVERAADVLTQIARALSYAHSRGVLHRDLKPSNILLDETGNAFLSDFGLAKLTESAASITRSDSIVGTPAYMSPEQLRAEALDKRSDIYGLGVIAYHLLTGAPPFSSSESNVVSIIYQHLEKQPDAPSSRVSGIPPELDAVVLRALAKRPEDRFADAIDFSNAFNQAIGRTLSTGSFPTVTIGAGIDLTTPSSGQLAGRESAPELPPAPDQGRVSPLLILGAAVASLAFAAIVLFAVGVFTPAPSAPLRHVVLQGERGAALDNVPTDAEVRAAVTRVGATGRVGYAACVQSTQYHAAQARELVEFARDYGLTMEVYNADNDPYRQVTQIETALAQGVRGLIVCPLDITLLDEPLRAAQRAGIPLVFFATQIESYGGVLIGSDTTDYDMGFAAGRALGEILLRERGGEANIAILDFPSMQIIVERANGLEDGVKSVAPGVNIIGRWVGGTRENGEVSIAGLIRDGVAFDAVLSINDAGAYGAIAALEAAGIPPEAVLISSVDAEQQARQYIAQGYYLRASVAVGREGFSRAAIDALVRMLAGATLPEVIAAPPGDTVTIENVSLTR